MENTFENIRKWGEAKGLLPKEHTYKQLAKATEEIGEVASAIIKNVPEDIKLEIGDVVVTMTILAAQHGYKIEDCIKAAYAKIEARKGTSTNGLFIKEA
jgi:NTP pyrophosphatase (non-canonical NTP hydrolase)